jgi:hypothetical protein
MKSFNNVLVILDKGFIYHGDLVVNDDGWFEITSARNVARFGTTRGLGQLAMEGPTKETKLYKCNDIKGRIEVLQHIMECSDAMLS